MHKQLGLELKIKSQFSPPPYVFGNQKDAPSINFVALFADLPIRYKARTPAAAPIVIFCVQYFSLSCHYCNGCAVGGHQSRSSGGECPGGCQSRSSVDECPGCAKRTKNQHPLCNILRELFDLLTNVAEKSITQPPANEHDGVDRDFF